MILNLEVKYLSIHFSLLLFFISSIAFSQKPEQNTSTKTSLYQYKDLEKYKEFLAVVFKQNSTKLDKKLQKDYTQIITEKNDDLIAELKEGNFLFDTAINKYLSSIFYYIIEKNGLNKNDFHFFVSRTSEVNASTYEDGTIICNLGILNIVETESQIAMILCHEIGHFLLNHPNISIIKSIEILNSDEFVTKVKEIKKEKYNTKTQIEGLLMKDLFDRRKHNRSQELAADSLGMLLLYKTEYGNNSIPQLFNLLDSSDIIETKCSIQSFFKKEGIATEDKWFAMPKKMRFGAATKTEIRDSLKTHPDCKKRKLFAENFFARKPKAGADFILISKNQLAIYTELATREETDYSRDKEHLSLCLYQLIQHDAIFQNSKYIKSEIFNTLLNICIRQKNHTLASSISQPYTPDEPNDEYAKLLQFLDVIDLKKEKEITLSYYEKNKGLIELTDQQTIFLNTLKQL